MDIIWPCVSTVALCLYSMVHLNVPALGDSEMTIILRKARWLVVGILAPELVMMYAFAQMTSAQVSVRDMTALGYADWTLAHGFYADSGGFLLHISGSAKPFPITAKQLAYLVREKIVDMPGISEREINDKSKADSTAKALTFIQCGYFVIRLFGRLIHHLPITPFELLSSALILCSLTTLWLWWKKPLDVRTPTAIHAKQDIATVLLDAGEAAKIPFEDTPLDFVEGHIYWSSKLSKVLLQWILRLKLQVRPLERIPNDRDYHPHSLKQNLYLAFPVSAFVAIHLAGWNLSLPTSPERSLWRINSLIMTLSLHVHCVSEALGFWWTDYAVGSLELWFGYKKRLPWSLIYIGLATVYFWSRMCLCVEAVISLRNLPEGAYTEVQWVQYIPQF